MSLHCNHSVICAGAGTCAHRRRMGAAGLTSFIAASISCSPSHGSTTQESDMATGWAGDGAVQDQIDANVKDAIKRVRSKLPQGPRLRRCEECGVEIRSEEHTSELQSLMRFSYDVFCMHKNTICRETK